MQSRFATFRNFSAMTLEVRVSNTNAIKLYEGLGFTKKKNLPGYYPDDEHGIRMIKYLEEQR
jgi:ribosomal-protein-alanine N-acetyltransferase